MTGIYAEEPFIMQNLAAVKSDCLLKTVKYLQIADVVQGAVMKAFFAQWPFFWSRQLQFSANNWHITCFIPQKNI
jgi:hypothetical protein